MSAALIWAGAVVCAFAAVRLLLTRDRLLRLHYVSLASVLAAPLVIAGLALASWSSWHDVAKLLIIGVLLFVTGPATVVTAGRAAKRASDG
jgi:multisubunit Na+/H+ antiporter MnhG subunit